jgi:hypothetical protein
MTPPVIQAAILFAVASSILLANWKLSLVLTTILALFEPILVCTVAGMSAPVALCDYLSGTPKGPKGSLC